jgi:CheY-like chemotaxis protein
MQNGDAGKPDLMRLKEPKYKYERVLLIDDDELDNFINQKTIEGYNFARNVYVNTSARGAIEFLTNLGLVGSGAPGNYPEVIFIDINMPIMDGFQFAEYFLKRMRDKMPGTKLVILTSSVFYEDIQKALDISEELVFLHKPLTREMLAAL